MDNFIKKHLQDIATAIDEIESFFDDQPKLFENFCKDLRLRRAIERNIAIVGDVFNIRFMASPIISIFLSIARSYIIHGYDSLSVDILWSIVVNHLPLLRQEVDILLDTQSKNK